MVGGVLLVILSGDRFGLGISCLGDVKRCGLCATVNVLIISPIASPFCLSCTL